ncbi:MAG: thiamine pyrophosphate-binding protein [Acidimicrobiales bacterium]
MHEAIGAALAAEGVTAVFGLMGDGNRRWMVDLAHRGVTLYHARHEGAALAMADGYARLTGSVGVCTVTYGPGVTQLSTSIMVAAKHGTPILVLAGGVDRAELGTGSHLDVDERAVLLAAGAIVEEVREPDQAAEGVHRAAFLAAAKGCPVALLVPVDLQDVPLAGHDGTPSGPLPRPSTEGLVPGRRSVDTAAAMLAGAQRPVVLAGRGAVLSGSRSSLDALAGRLGALVATTFQAKGFFDGHPHDVGLAGGFSFARTRALLHRADFVVSVGTSLDAHTTDGGRLFPEARVIQVDVRPYHLIGGRSVPALHLQGDAQATVDELVAALDRRGGCGPGWRAAELREVLDGDPRTEEITSHDVKLEEGSVDPRRLMLELDRLLPEDAAVVIGGGHFMAFPSRYLSNPGGRSFEMVFDFMTTGQAVPAAIGAAVGAPERMVVAIEGDASFLMHVQEIETAARHGITLLVLVMNDGALGAEYHKLRAEGLDPSQSLAPTPDLASVASALGGTGFRLHDVDQVPDVISWFDRGRGPHVVDCAVSKAVVGPL